MQSATKGAAQSNAVQSVADVELAVRRLLRFLPFRCELQNLHCVRFYQSARRSGRNRSRRRVAHHASGTDCEQRHLTFNCGRACTDPIHGLMSNLKLCIYYCKMWVQCTVIILRSECARYCCLCCIYRQRPLIRARFDIKVLGSCVFDVCAKYDVCLS